MTKYKVDFESIPWENPATGIRFKSYQQGERKLRLIEFLKEFVEQNWCTKGHIGYVLEGKMAVDFDGKSIEFDPGDGIFISPGNKHKAKILTDLVKVILVEDN
jgi:quercetin dioxygenase-like cupin family protein